MASVMAIVAKAVFEKQARGLGEGDVWPIDRYASKGKVLDALADGGSLFLVTVRPPEQLWLVGVLAAPEHDGEAWTATANTTPIRSIHAEIKKLVLANGNGLTFEKGKLGMSLQGPRVLAESDVSLLSGAGKKSTAKQSVPKASVADASVAKKSIAKESAVAKQAVAKMSVANPPAANQAVAQAAPAKGAAKAVSLDRVYVALDKGDHDKALALMIDLWKTARSPVLAKAIDILTTRVGSGVIAGDSPPALAKAWNKVEKAGDSADLELLLAQIRAGTDIDGVAARVDKLAKKFPDDPRLASFVHKQLDDLAFTASSSVGVWDSLFKMLDRVHDPRTVAVVERNRAKWGDKLSARGGYRKRFLAWMDNAKVVAQLRVPIEVDSDIVARVSEINKRVLSEDEQQLAALFAEVYNNPDDDHVRMVLADALVERDDPRGELIHLQLRTDPLSKQELLREKELIETHGRDWLGALGEWCSKKPKELIFERGFAWRMTIVKPPTSQPAFPVDAPEMATIESLDIGHNLDLDNPGLYEWIRRFPRVRCLEASASRIERLLEGGPVSYTELVTYDPREEVWFTHENFPKLERIRIPRDGGRIVVSKGWKIKKVS